MLVFLFHHFCSCNLCLKVDFKAPNVGYSSFGFIGAALLVVPVSPHLTVGFFFEVLLGWEVFGRETAGYVFLFSIRCFFCCLFAGHLSQICNHVVQVRVLGDDPEPM